MKYGIKIAALAMAPVAFGSAIAITAGTSSPASAGTHHSHQQRLPAGYHWKHASKAAAKEVCGNGPAIIAWGGKGDTSVIICKNGKAETS